MMSYKNKTGYKRRMGHRQSLTQIRVTDIGTAKKATKAAASEAPAETTKDAE
jgi:hypothetical protein